MILYTSDTKTPRQKLLKTALVYLGITVFCIVFTNIYEHYSYGEFSIYMRRMFWIPLLLGYLPFWVAYLLKKNVKINRIGYNLWNSGVAVLIHGCIIKGIIHISGRFTEYDSIYWILGVFLLLIAILFYVMSMGKNHSTW